MNLGSVRDLSIIILALESIVVGVLLGVLIVQVTKLIRMLRDEVMPILYSTQETLNTMRGTTTFISDRVVQPVVKVSSYTAGMRQAISVLFGRTDGRS
jgi:BioD-like phosphotransacetylase family protein